MIKDKKALIGRSALIATTLIWGTSFVVFKSALNDITPLWVLAIRFGGAALIMLLAALPKLRELDRNYIKGGAIMGLCLAAAYTLQTYGLVYTTPGKNAFLTATYCILVPFLCWLLFKKKPDRYNVSAAVICLVGMGFVCLNDDLSVNLGDMLTVSCGLFFGLHIIATSHYVECRNVLLLTMLQFAVAGALCLVFAMLFEPRPANIPGSSWVSIAYLTVVCTGVCFFLQTVGQKYTPPSAVAVIMTLESVFGTALSIIMGQENITVKIALGFCLIFVAIFISETKLEFLRKK